MRKYLKKFINILLIIEEVSGEIKLFFIFLFILLFISNIALYFNIKAISTFFIILIINTPRKGMVFCMVSTPFFQYHPTWDGMVSVNASPIR